MPVIERQTKETRIRVEIARGRGAGSADTTVPFLDHMLVALARGSQLDLAVTARGDLGHHIVEDVAIAVGAAVRALVTPTIARYGDRVIPMDDALVQVAIDIGGRAYYRGPLPSTRYDHWMRSFAHTAQATLHVRVVRGQDRHHVVEAGFKALGRALALALAEASTLQSTKGEVRWEGAP